jgi:hypothetical protein
MKSSKNKIFAIQPSIACLCWFLVIAETSIAQTANENYIVVYKALVPINGDLSLINDKTKVNETIQYMDGLGRPIQSVSRQGSSLGYDVVSFWVYDAYGRKTQTYLPYVSGTTSGNSRTSPIPEQSTFFQNLFGSSDGAKAFSIQLVEDSELGRVIKQGATGAAWQPGNSDVYALDDKTVKKRYEVNGASEILRFFYNPSTSQVSLATDATRFYDQFQLTVNKTFDEHNNDIAEYVDKEGRTVCKKVKASATEYAFTYYIYDDLGNLVVVLPPEATKTFQN